MPTNPQIVEGYDDVGPIVGVIQYGDYTNDTSPLVRIALGDQAAAGDRLGLSDAGAATAASVILTPADLARGYVDLQLSNLSSSWHPLTAVLAADSTVIASSMVWALGVETSPPAAPVITGASDNVGLQVGGLTDGASTDDATPTFHIFEAGEPAVPTGSPGHAPYGGPAVLNATVQLYEGNALLATALAGPGGDVDLTPGPLAPGDHAFTVVVTDRAGNVSDTSAPFHLTVGPDAKPIASAGGSGDDTIQGGSGADTITAVSGSNYLRGNDGNDAITGGSGFDDINGNKGQDTLHGGAGDDWVVGGQGNDLLYGDTGDDVVLGNLGSDTLEGGAGNDIMRGGQANDVLIGGDGNDWLSGDRGDDTITGGAGADIFHSFSGAAIDRITDFNSAEGDRVQLDPGTAYALSQQGADTVIDMGHGDEVILAGVQYANLAPGWIFLA